MPSVRVTAKSTRRLIKHKQRPRVLKSQPCPSLKKRAALLHAPQRAKAHAWLSHEFRDAICGEAEVLKARISSSKTMSTTMATTVSPLFRVNSTSVFTPSWA